MDVFNTAPVTKQAEAGKPLPSFDDIFSGGSQPLSSSA
jgi:hypothetical protein